MKIGIPFSAGARVNKFASANSAVDPTWSIETVDTTKPAHVSTGLHTRIGCAVTGSAQPVTAWVWSDDPDNESPSSFHKIYRSARSAGGSWGSAVEVVDQQDVDGSNNLINNLIASPVAGGMSITWSQVSGQRVWYGSVPIPSGTFSFYEVASAATVALAAAAGQNVVRYAGNLYLQVEIIGGNRGVYRSTDSGATWTRQDSSNEPPDYGFTVARVLMDGQYVKTYGIDNSLRTLRMDQFDMAALAWDTTAVFDDGPMLYGDNEEYDEFASFPKSTWMARRSDGSLLLLYPGWFTPGNYEDVAGTGYRRTYARVWRAGSWSSRFALSTGLAEHQQPIGVVIGANDVAHVFLQTQSADATAATLKHISIDIDDNLGTLQTVSEDVVDIGTIGYLFFGNPVSWCEASSGGASEGCLYAAY